MELGLKGKVALVTAASKGIGKAIAEEFAKEGATVSICARGLQALATTAEELRRYGVPVVATPADVTKVEPSLKSSTPPSRSVDGLIFWSTMRVAAGWGILSRHRMSSGNISWT